MFMDLGERNLISGQSLKRGPMLGRGAFGFVYRATVNVNGSCNADVAVKMLQPVNPGPDARSSILQLYKVCNCLVSLAWYQVVIVFTPLGR